MSVELVTITQPATEPLTTAEAKAHLRVTHSDDDTYIDALVSTARINIEARAGVRMFTQTTELRGDSFAQLADRSLDIIPLRVSPVQSVDSIKYYDANDADTTWSSSAYWEDLTGVPCRVQLKDTESFPILNRRIGNVRIRMTTGYSSVSDIPAHYLQAMKLLIGHLYENREQTISGTIISDIPDGITNLLMLAHGEYQHYTV